MSQSSASVSEEEEGISEVDTPQETSEAICVAVNKILEESPDLSEAELDELIDEFGKAIQLDVKNVEAYIGKAYLQGLQDRYAQGQETLQMGLAECPGNAKLQEMLHSLQALQQETLPPPQDIPLLVEEGTMTKGFYDALVWVFDKFDHSHKGQWDEKDISSFYEAVNGETLPSSVLTFLLENFAEPGETSLRLEGLLQFYLSQTAGDPQETWNDLQKLGFDEFLHPPSS